MTAPELDLAAVKATAEAATKGPWHVTHSGLGIYSTNRTSVGMAGTILAHGSELRQEADAKHIATMDPSTTLVLVDRLEQAEREVERLRGVVARVGAMAQDWEDDDDAHLVKHGQHLPGSVARMAELVHIALEDPS